jgi:hypothetical protein
VAGLDDAEIDATEPKALTYGIKIIRTHSITPDC